MKDYGYNRNDVKSDYERLPKGAYVGKVISVKWEEGKNGNSDMLKFAFDITEGEFKDYFKKVFEGDQREDKKWKGVFTLFCPKNDGSERDGWTKRSFNSVIAAFEDSNNGFHFDGSNEQCLKGKAIGLVFRDKEYEKQDGSVGICTDCADMTSVDKVKKGTYRVPKDKLITKPSTSTSTEGFISIPTGDGDELPF